MAVNTCIDIGNDLVNRPWGVEAMDLSEAIRQTGSSERCYCILAAMLVELRAMRAMAEFSNRQLWAIRQKTAPNQKRKSKKQTPKPSRKR